MHCLLLFPDVLYTKQIASDHENNENNANIASQLATIYKGSCLLVDGHVVR